MALAQSYTATSGTYSEPYIIKTLAGSTVGSTDGNTDIALFSSPTSVAVDGLGNIYVADTMNDTIRKITPAGVVTTLAGTPGRAGAFDGTGSAALFSEPAGVAVDKSGTVYVADSGNNAIREITPNGVVTTLAGGINWFDNNGYNPNGEPARGGAADGIGPAAEFSLPMGVAVDGAGDVFVADTGNNSIRKITSNGVVTTLVGGGGDYPGDEDGTGRTAKFHAPTGVAVDSSGNVYVADTGNGRIRKIMPALVDGVTTWVASTFAGGGNNNIPTDGTGSEAVFLAPSALAFDGLGNLYVADAVGETIRKIDPAGLTSTLAGGNTYIAVPEGRYGYLWESQPGDADGTGSAALFNSPSGIAVDPSGNIYVADTGNNSIRTGPPAPVLYVASQPQDQSVQPGDSVSFSVQVSQPSSSNYQWQVSTDGGSTWTNLADGNGVFGSSTPTLRLSPAGAGLDGNQYQCEVTGTATATSAAATLAVGPPSMFTPYPFTTLAGSGSGGADGTGSAAQFRNPGGMAMDGAGNLYVADTGDDTIRKMTPAGSVTTLAGAPGFSGSADGTGSAAHFKAPGGVAIDRSGNVYVADTGNDTIRKITTAGVVTTLAGAAGQDGSSDGVGPAAQFLEPNGVAVDSAGNVYVADTGNDTIREITSAGVVTTLAGTAGDYATSDGTTNSTGSGSRFAAPMGIGVDGAGNVYVAETGSDNVRMITQAGLVTTLAGPPYQEDGFYGVAGFADGTGSAVRFQSPSGLSVTASGVVYVADSGNDAIRIIAPGGVVTTLATGFNDPLGIAVDASGKVYVADSANNEIREVTPSATVSTLAGSAGIIGLGSSDGAGAAARFDNPAGVAVDAAGNVFVADSGNDTIRKITQSGTVTTLAGTAGQSGSTDGAGLVAQFFNPVGVAVDGAGNVYVGDTGNNEVRKITPAGLVSTLAGSASGRPIFGGNVDGTGSAAQFGGPEGVAVDVAGNVYVADLWNNAIRKVSPTGVVTTIATTGLDRFPYGVAVDGAGNVYVDASVNGDSIQKITPAGLVTTIAGSGATGKGGDAPLFSPSGLAVDNSGNVFVAVTGDDTIREITPSGVVTTLAGAPGHVGTTDATGSAALFNAPLGIAVDARGNLYVADTSNNEIRKGTAPSQPAITTQPASQTVSAGSEVILSVVAWGNSSLNYQWTLNGSPIAGANGAQLVLSNVDASNAGSYEVEVADSLGSELTSSPATLAINAVSGTGFVTQPVSQVVALGGTVVFSVATGGSIQPSLARTGGESADFAAGTTYQWKFNGANLSDGNGISGSEGPVLVIQGATVADNGDYSCVMTTGTGSVTSETAGLWTESVTDPGAVSSLSARAFVGSGDDILIGGFYITGSTSATVLVQAIGPALAPSPYSVSGTLQHPALTIHQNQNGKDVVLYSNTGWGSSPVLLAAAAAAYAQPVLQPGSPDSELLVTLPPGGYTAEVTGSDGGTGVALCGIYQLP